MMQPSQEVFRKTMPWLRKSRAFDLQPPEFQFLKLGRYLRKSKKGLKELAQACER
jgi:hypothetical protein